MYFYCYVYVFLLLCMFRYVYSVSFCCSVYCVSVNVYYTAATGYNPLAVNISYHVMSYIISYRIISDITKSRQRKHTSACILWNFVHF